MITAAKKQLFHGIAKLGDMQLVIPAVVLPVGFDQHLRDVIRPALSCQASGQLMFVLRHNRLKVGLSSRCSASRQMVKAVFGIMQAGQFRQHHEINAATG